MSGQPNPAARWSLMVLLLVTAGCPPESINDGEPPANVNANDGASGSPLPNPVSVVVDGGGEVDQQAVGDSVTLTAVPEPGWRFDRWTGSVSSTLNPLTIGATEGLSVTAVFLLETAEPEPEQPVPGNVSDVDEDGVLNAMDQCPGTDEGASVDATGCSATQRDNDRDDISDAEDNCPNTAFGAEVDENGCAATQRDTDRDGVVDARDECPDTAQGTVVLADGCPPAIADADGDGVADAVDRCPQTPAGATVDAATGCRAGELPVCGNGVVETGEQCDPPNAATCSASCMSITPPPANDLCSAPATLLNGTTTFNNATATTTGTVAVASGCVAAEFQSDLWYCYTASCTGLLSVSTCPGAFDTLVAIYNGCACPGGSAVSCDDDGCGPMGAGSLATAAVTSGQQYLIRVGGWQGARGTGSIAVNCMAATVTCGNGVVEAGEQCDPPNGTTCSATCQNIVQQPICGNGVVETGEQCEPPNTATCGATCQTITSAAVCGNGVVETGEQCEPPGLGNCDSSCRLRGGGSVCGNGIVESGEECEPPNVGDCDAACHRVTVQGCGPESGDCCRAHQGAGCSNEECCQRICQIDPFCCGAPPTFNGTWDDQCAALAARDCQECADGCITPCPFGSLAESEANCGLPFDSVNGGCIFSFANPQAIPITCGGATRCGTTAYSEELAFGDTDWFEINLTQATEVTVTLTGESPLAGFFVHTFPPGVGQCDAFSAYTPSASGEACEPVTLRTCLPPGQHWIVVIANVNTELECGARYTLDVACASCDASPPPNDACSGAEAVAVGGTARAETTRATGDAFAPVCSGVSSTAQGVWYKVTGNGNRLTASTCDFGTDFDTQLSVYCNGCTASTCIASNDDVGGDFCGPTSEVSWCSQRRAEYLILVHGSGRAGGSFELNVTNGAPCSGAMECGGSSGPACGPGRGDCRTVHSGEGCDNISCCEGVCEFDATCCEVGWDADCVVIADLVCPP